MFGVHWWIHLITVTALAMVFNQYRTLQQILHEEHRVKLWNSGPMPVSPGVINMPMNPFQVPSAQPNVEYTESNAQDESGGLLQNSVMSHGSSVWCEGKNHDDRRCHFKNVCFVGNTTELVFCHHINSVLYNIPTSFERFSPGLCSLTSQKHQNSSYLDYIDLKSTNAAQVLKDSIEYRGHFLAFKRSLPDNLFRVFHDDLLPVFSTLQHIERLTPRVFKSNLLILDSHEKGKFWSLYEALVGKEPIVYKSASPGKAVCFENFHVGLEKDTLWYDHGYDQAQGPIAHSTLDIFKLRQFTEYIKSNIGLPMKRSDVSSNAKQKLAVLLLRMDIGLILNEDELVNELVLLKYRVAKFALNDETSMRTAIEQISEATLVLGIHSSLMTLAMFAPPGALILELFPYALNPEDYTPYRTLVNTDGLGLSYKSWRNTRIQMSISHPNRPKEQGGIGHLPEVEQQRILASNSVPPHKCCSDPEYMFRIYQDTYVDTIEIRMLIEDHLKVMSLPHLPVSIEDTLDSRLYPGPVEGLRCTTLAGKAQPMLSIDWTVPWNINFLDSGDVEYELVLFEYGSGRRKIWRLKTTRHQFVEDIYPEREYLIRVRTIRNKNMFGPYNSETVRCFT